MLVATPTDSFDEAVSSALAEEVSALLDNTQDTQLTNALNDADQQRLSGKRR
jgi:hypothetical protein